MPSSSALPARLSAERPREHVRIEGQHGQRGNVTFAPPAGQGRADEAADPGQTVQSRHRAPQSPRIARSCHASRSARDRMRRRAGLPRIVAISVHGGEEWTQRVSLRRRVAPLRANRRRSSDTSAEPAKTAIAKPIRRNDHIHGLGGLVGNRSYRQSIGQRMDEPILDCLIVGGGPAGLTAAIYLARFHLDILVVDGGKSRAAWIPVHAQPRRLSRRNRGKELLAANARPGLQIWREDRDRVRHQARARRRRAAVHRDLGFRLRDRAQRPARDRGHQPPPADGRGASRRSARARPGPLLPDLRRL